MDINQIWSTILQWLKPITDWLESDPMYILISAIANIGGAVTIIIALATARKARKEQREERKFKEEQLKLNREINAQLSQYKELFGDLEINSQLKQLIVQRENSIKAADEQLSRLDLSIDERNEILARKQEDIQQLENEKNRILSQREDDLKIFQERLNLIIATAQNEALRETIKKRLEVLQRELSEIEMLKKDYELADSRLELPNDVKNSLLESLQDFVPPRKEHISQPHLFRVFFLALLVFLLPYPVDYIVLIVASVPLLLFVLDSIQYMENSRIQLFAIKGYKILTFITLYALWVSVISWLKDLVNPFINQIFSNLEYSIYNSQYSQFGGGSDNSSFYQQISPSITIEMINVLRFIVRIAPYILALLVSGLDYFRVIKPISKKVVEIRDQLKPGSNVAPE